MSKNDITGDRIASKVPSAKFDVGYDLIWGAKNEPATAADNSQSKSSAEHSAPSPEELGACNKAGA